jgi:hypothetical protein
MGHAAAVSRGEVAAKVHPKLDPKKKNRAGEVIRESNDSTDHPNSVPVAVIFDTTGSMNDIPEKIVKKLPDLMDLIIKRKFLADPQVLFGAVNDASTMAVAPLEVGQFESGNQMDDVLTNILVTQGGGGGTSQESYELAMYFLARHSKLDCYDKRNRKGYLFIVGDEMPYDFVDKSEVKQIIGDDLPQDISVEEILKELKLKYNVFWLFPGGSAHWNDTVVKKRLEKLLGQNVIMLPDPEQICTAIAGAIGVCEGLNPKEVAKQLKEGLSSDAKDKEIEDLVASIPGRRLDDF